MASPRPPYHRSASRSTRDNRSYEKRDRDYESQRLLPTKQQRAQSTRPRSPSRVRYPYTSNCSRRRWPPSPKVEEVKYEEEIPMRGLLDQKPMIIEATRSADSDTDSDYSGFSCSSSEAETPPASESSGEQRYGSKSKPDVPISKPYDMTKGRMPTAQRPAPEKEDRGRGRGAMPKIDTELARSKSRAEPLPQLERARSPYASGPQDRRPKPDRFSGEYLLSPDMMSPRKQFVESPRNRAPYSARPDEDHRKERLDHDRETSRRSVRPSMEKQRAHSHYVPRPIDIQDSRRDTLGTQSPKTPTRPSLDRRASEMPYPSGSATSSRNSQVYDTSNQVKRPTLDRRASDRMYPTPPPSASGITPRSRRSNGASDDSDSDYVKTRHSSGKASPKIPLIHSNTPPNYIRHHERRFSSELPLSPSHRHSTSSSNQVLPVNLSSLIGGAAITQTLNSMLNNGDRSANRHASPRPSPLPSPKGSPTTSPYSSPPRTPPPERSQHRTNPVAELKKDSPTTSKPSSPLSSRSSLWTADYQPPLREIENDRKHQPPPLKSRQTAPLPSPRVDGTGNSSLLATPDITVRSPSPAQANKPHPGQSGAPHQHRPENNLQSTTPNDLSQPSIPKSSRPGGLAGRPRALSNVDVRPQLFVNPVPFLQPTEPVASPRSRSRANSPSLMSPEDRYKPSSHLEPAAPTKSSNSSRPEPAASNRLRSRSRSYVPESNPVAPLAQPMNHDSNSSASKLGSSMPVSVPSTRSKSAAPKPAPATLPAIPPANLPLCPRSHSVAGHDDWYTLKHNDSFIICPSCRDHVFGSHVDYYLKHRPVSSTRKTLCDLNNPWIRLACLLRGPDINLLSSLSEITSKERSCPEDRLAPRDWFRLEDPDNGKHIVGFNACPHCVKSLETLFPPWRDVFYRPRTSNHHDLKERFCGLRTSGLRFGDYLDMIVESIREAESKRKSPNTKPVRDLAKQLADIEDCPKDAMFPKKAWHIHPHLPEFTICQECYEDVVYPIVKTGSTLASKIDKKPQQFSDPTMEICCHLYSPRMRKVFREACEDDDYEHLRHTVLKRHMLQRDLLDTFKEQQKDPGDTEVGERLRDLLGKWKDKE